MNPKLSNVLFANAAQKAATLLRTLDSKLVIHCDENDQPIAPECYHREAREENRRQNRAAAIDTLLVVLGIAFCFGIAMLGGR